MAIQPDWDLFTPTGGDKTDFTTHVCMYNVFNALGKIVNSRTSAKDASEPTVTSVSPSTYVASFIVYMAHIVALATATEAKRPMTDGNPVVYTFDVYASLLWCCRKIKERTYLGTTPLTANDVFELLRQEWRQDELYLKDETTSILWATFVPRALIGNGILHELHGLDQSTLMEGEGDKIPPRCTVERDLVLLSTVAALCGHDLSRFFLWVGHGSNGKSKLADFIRMCFGEYTCSIPVSLFTNKRGAFGEAVLMMELPRRYATPLGGGPDKRRMSSAAAPELARTRGRRVAFISEPLPSHTSR
jgi:hypothetical protein